MSNSDKKWLTRTSLPLECHEEFVVCAANYEGQELAVLYNKVGARWPSPLPIRIHSSCVYGEVFGSVLCDCSAQVHAMIDVMSVRGGLLVYLFQEGRSFGLVHKTEAMELELTRNISTAEAYKQLGAIPDSRKYDAAIYILRRLDVPNKLSLFTNNPHKVAALREAGFDVSRERLDVRLKPRTQQKVFQKQKSLGHIIDGRKPD